VKFTVLCSNAISVFNQAIRTCDIRANNTDADFLLKESDGRLWVTSINRNMEQTILIPTVSLSANKNESFFISGQVIVELFRQFPDDEVSCNYEGNVLIIEGDDTSDRQIKLELPTSEADDFAPFNYVSESTIIECDAAKIVKSLESTSFCASTDEDDNGLTAVHITLADDKLTVEASDNDRVAVSEIEIDNTDKVAIDCLLPKESANTLISLIKRVDIVKIEKGKNHLRFFWNDTTFTSCLTTDDDYPDLTQYINGTVVASAKISKEELIKSLRLLGLLVKDSFIALKLGSNGLKISANEKDRGSGSYVIDPQKITGNSDAPIPYKFLVQAAEAMVKPWVTINFVELAYGDQYPHVSLVEEGYLHFVFAGAAKDEDSSDG
jgi:DNA polymerase III sliding clamp (beta) subunit (PCNA family)